MKRGIIWIALTFLMIIFLVLSSCAISTSASTTTSMKVPSTTIATSVSSTPPSSITPNTTKTNTTSSPTSGSNWWDKYGIPQYGGELILRSPANITAFDPNSPTGQVGIMDGWLERLHGDNWTLDPTVFDYKINFRPSDYVKGNVAQSWEFPDPSTYVLHLRSGIHWQNIAPANGREFIADDVVFHYDRFFGLGSGITPSPYYGTMAAYQDLISVTATDKYTVVFKWKTPNPENIMETLQALGSQNNMENSDAVKLWGNLND
jgi:ABC-type transport system substrate-binding protein